MPPAPRAIVGWGQRRAPLIISTWQNYDTPLYKAGRPRLSFSHGLTLAHQQPASSPGSPWLPPGFVHLLLDSSGSSALIAFPFISSAATAVQYYYSTKVTVSDSGLFICDAVYPKRDDRRGRNFLLRREVRAARVFKKGFSPNLF